MFFTMAHLYLDWPPFCEQRGHCGPIATNPRSITGQVQDFDPPLPLPHAASELNTLLWSHLSKFWRMFCHSSENKSSCLLVEPLKIKKIRQQSELTSYTITVIIIIIAINRNHPKQKLKSTVPRIFDKIMCHTVIPYVSEPSNSGLKIHEVPLS